MRRIEIIHFEPGPDDPILQSHPYTHGAED
jgi:hypothetical protein